MASSYSTWKGRVLGLQVLKVIAQHLDTIPNPETLLFIEIGAIALI